MPREKRETPGESAGNGVAGAPRKAGTRSMNAAFNKRINALFKRDDWKQARSLLETEFKKNPSDHWLLTQLAVTFYEERKYKKALGLLVKSLKIVPDCPLTLWNVGGALDATGQHGSAIRVYTWLLRSKKSPAEDPCWESEQWADVLKTDCIYRIGVCFKNEGAHDLALHCFHQYLNLLMSGKDASYSLDDVHRHMLCLNKARTSLETQADIQKAVASTLEAAESAANGADLEMPRLLSTL